MFWCEHSELSITSRLNDNFDLSNLPGLVLKREITQSLIGKSIKIKCRCPCATNPYITITTDITV